ncbi:MAG TPA: hypothetical protein VG899_11955 [Mycobacteriales bacterium]|nr:hypothetical protein [Mycobacteriales bacterium]
MSSPWALAVLLFTPSLFGLALLMNWLETHFTHQLVADELAIAWRSTESADDLEEEVGRIVARVMVDSAANRPGLVKT